MSAEREIISTSLGLFGFLLLGCATRPVGPDVAKATAYLEKGKEEAHRGNHESAVALYSRAIEAYPEFSAAYYERGYSRLQLRRSPETQGNVRVYEDGALDDYTLAIHHNPGFADAYFNRALILRSRAQFKPAAEDLLNVARLRPQDPEPHLDLGQIYEQYFEDLRPQAYDHYEKYADLGGKDAEARRKAMLWKDLKKQATANPPSKKAPTPDDEKKAADLHAQAMRLLEEKKREEAVKAIDELLSAYGHTRYVQERLAALRVLQNALKKETPK